MRFTVISPSVSISAELQLVNLSEPIRGAPDSLITLIYSGESVRSGLTVDRIISLLLSSVLRSEGMFSIAQACSVKSTSMSL